MATMREIDRLRMRRRQKEIEVNKAKEKLHDLEEELKELDQKIIALMNSGENGGFGRINI